MRNAATERLTPQNLEAEQSLLGAMLIDDDAIATAMEVLTERDLYRESHRQIFNAIVDLFNRHDSVDLVTVAEELRKRDQLEAVGGGSYLTQLIDIVPTAANVEQYARIVEGKSILRGLIKAADRITEWAYSDEDEVKEIVDRSERAVFEIGQRRVTEAFTKIQPLLDEAYHQIERMHEHHGTLSGIPTGYGALDELTSGFQRNDLIIIAGRPSMGKTAFAMNIAEHIALFEKLPVAIFSLEMSKEQLVQRLICSRAMVNSNQLRTGRLGEDDWERITRAVVELEAAPIFIDDTPDISTFEMRARARRLQAEHPQLGLIVVDYLQLARPGRRAENRNLEISEIARGLKSLARELKVPLAALSQLSRAVEQRDNKRPILSDLRESGSIEAEADLVMFVYRNIFSGDERLERLLLGAMMKDPDATGRAIRVVQEEDFHQQHHRAIFRALEILHRRSAPLDVESVYHQLETQGAPSAAMSKRYLYHLYEGTAVVEKVEQYASILKKAARSREDEPDPGTAEIIVGKHRNGPIGTIELGFLNDYAKFTNLSKEDRKY